MIDVRCSCGWPKPPIAIARPDGSAVEGEMLVRLVCPVCETPYTAGELADAEVTTQIRDAAEAGINPAERELALVVNHITACANVLARTPLPHAEETARSFHMLAIALGDHKAHRGQVTRDRVVAAVADTLRQLGTGAPKA